MNFQYLNTHYLKSQMLSLLQWTKIYIYIYRTKEDDSTQKFEPKGKEKRVERSFLHIERRTCLVSAWAELQRESDPVFVCVRLLSSIRRARVSSRRKRGRTASKSLRSTVACLNLNPGTKWWSWSIPDMKLEWHSTGRCHILYKAMTPLFSCMSPERVRTTPHKFSWNISSD